MAKNTTNIKRVRYLKTNGGGLYAIFGNKAVVLGSDGYVREREIPKRYIAISERDVSKGLKNTLRKKLGLSPVS